jgi:hypothetical protein
MIAKADKGKTIIITDKNLYRHKVFDFLQDNHYIKLQKDPTDLYHNHTQKAMQDCNLIIDTRKKRYLTQIKTSAPKINALLKLHKDDEPIKPLVNNMHAPTYKLAKFLKKWLSETLQLSNRFISHNSTQLADDLHSIN